MTVTVTPYSPCLTVRITLTLVVCSNHGDLRSLRGLSELVVMRDRQVLPCPCPEIYLLVLEHNPRI